LIGPRPIMQRVTSRGSVRSAPSRNASKSVAAPCLTSSENKYAEFLPSILDDLHVALYALVKQLKRNESAHAHDREPWGRKGQLVNLNHEATVSRPAIIRGFILSNYLDQQLSIRPTIPSFVQKRIISKLDPNFNTPIKEIVDSHPGVSRVALARVLNFAANLTCGSHPFNPHVKRHRLASTKKQTVKKIADQHVQQDETQKYSMLNIPPGYIAGSVLGSIPPPIAPPPPPPAWSISDEMEQSRISDGRAQKKPPNIRALIMQSMDA